ncbi:MULTISPECIES: hypothetical protein [Paraburkholderia]|uniref:Uncharacterized protein n=1 Tax=Paraburkholderia madseniana TaxID=2599607 RepID=A0AAP5BIY3_9BURK|nr:MULTISPECIES: hypothetical protein [Paraburkholderia]MCX4149838.1 hypothetical protein [Paraburkholderia madseniana]MDN7152774.1 hypothetical protein [Paraburkholderia sp. WS6]MDQ6411656.1 hypothetical protein [Paraburkholderia madseniana]
MDSDIPQEDLYVTQCEQVGSALELRFVLDFHPDSPPNDQVLQITLAGLDNVPTCVDFFRDLLHNKPIYLQREGNRLTATAGHGTSLSMQATTLTIRHDRLNRQELLRQVALIHDWYLAANRGLVKSSARISAVRTLISESIRRTDLKASGHDRDGLVSVLYAQQVHTLNRILRLLDE